MPNRKFIVTYNECYSRDYEVEAVNAEDAMNRVRKDVMAKRRPAPNNCYETSCLILKAKQRM